MEFQNVGKVVGEALSQVKSLTEVGFSAHRWIN